MLQAWEAFADVGKPQQRAVAVLNIGGVDHGMNKVSAGVRPEMALATFDLFARILAANAAAFSGFDALTVDHTRACTPALDLAARPSASPRIMSRSLLIACHKPLSRHAWK